MAGDIEIRERLVLVQPDVVVEDLQRSVENSPGELLHQYGTDCFVIGMDQEDEADVVHALPSGAAPIDADSGSSALDRLSDTGRLGAEALALRNSPSYVRAKASRPFDGSSWDTDEATTPGCSDLATKGPNEQADQEDVRAPAPPSNQRLQGRIAVGLVIVEGPGADLRLTPDQRKAIVAETQNGLSWLGGQNTVTPVSWIWDIKTVTLTIPRDAPASDDESRFRDPALAKLGFEPGHEGVRLLADDLRDRLHAESSYVAFFTQYPIHHFAYAFLGGRHLVMDFDNDGWEPPNIDRVFAHETGHIFNAPDEYRDSGCNCEGTFGVFGTPNGNCETCAQNGGTPCIMKANTWEVCEFTPSHLGISPKS